MGTHYFNQYLPPEARCPQFSDNNCPHHRILPASYPPYFTILPHTTLAGHHS